MAEKQFTSALKDILDDEQKRAYVLERLMLEVEGLIESMIIFALDKGHLSPKALKEKPSTKATRSRVIITEEE